VYDLFDLIISDYGDLLYMGLVYVAIPLIAWILSGGLRRQQVPREPDASISIIVIHPLTRPPDLPPPTIRQGCDTFADDDEDSFAA
jgi:hypothetical protein